MIKKSLILGLLCTSFIGTSYAQNYEPFKPLGGLDKSTLIPNINDNNDSESLLSLINTANNSILKSSIGIANGVAPLDSESRLYSPLWSPSITSSPSTSNGGQPLINAGRFPITTSLSNNADPFQSPDALQIGGLPTKGWNVTTGLANNEVARPGSLVIAGQPWGPFNAGALESILFSQNIDAQNGVCTKDWRQGAGNICGGDGVGQYIGVINTPAFIAPSVSNFTSTSVVLKTPLTAEQISQLRIGMYINTNIINNTSVPYTHSDTWGSSENPQANFYLGVISGWSTDGTTINVSAWDIPASTSHPSGQIPGQQTGDTVDTFFSNYGYPVVFIGNPNNGSARNEYLAYDGSRAGDISGVFTLYADVASGSSTLQVSGTPETVSGYDTNITGAGIVSGTTVTGITTVNGVSTLTLSSPITSAASAGKTTFTIYSSGISNGSATAHALTADEIDLRYWATRKNEVHLDGITISVAGSYGTPVGREALTQDSFAMALSGDIHNLLKLDGPTDGNAIIGQSIYVGGGQGSSSANTLYEMSDIGAFPDSQGNSEMRLATFMTKETDTVGPGGNAIHLGIINGGSPGDGIPTGMTAWGQVVFNQGGTNNGGVSLCGGVGGNTGSDSSCGVQVDYNGTVRLGPQVNAQGPITMQNGQHLIFAPSDGTGWSYWYAPPGVSGLTLSAKTYQGGDASLTAYSASLSGELTVQGQSDFYGQANEHGSLNIETGGSFTLSSPSGNAWMGMSTTDDSTIKLKTSAGGDTSLSGVYNLTSSGMITANGGLTIPYGTPASSSATCIKGQMEVDSTYIYSCVDTNTWHRESNGAAW